MINAVWLFAFTGPQSFICNSKIEKWGGGMAHLTENSLSG